MPDTADQVLHQRALALLGKAVKARCFGLLGVRIDENKLREAEACIEKAISLAQREEERAVYYTTAAQINMSSRRYDRAYELASKATDCCIPPNPEAMRMKGMAAYATGRLAEAASLLELVLSEHPELEGVREPLAMIYRDSGLQKS